MARPMKHLSVPARAGLLVTSALAAMTLAACDDPPKSGAGTTTAAATTAAPPPTAAALPKPKTMPEMIVDSDGAYIGGGRINLGEASGAEKLAKAVKDLPINGAPVTLQAEKKAKTSHVAAVVAALGEAGAPKVIIKTDGRGDLPKEISVTPESRISSPPGCSVTTTVLKDLSTAIWPVKGATAKRQRKGLAGPDLTHTGEEVTKEIAACDSTMAFFSSDDEVSWELAFNLAGTVVKADEKKKIDTLVLLREEPVAGRPVTIGKH
ncbi:MAG: biopolymer transporter ExbD [Byssovorax sp.]